MMEMAMERAILHIFRVRRDRLLVKGAACRSNRLARERRAIAAISPTARNYAFPGNFRSTGHLSGQRVGSNQDLFGDGGTFLPALRASDKPMAIACLGFVTFFLLRPLFNFPFFMAFISVSTFLEALGEYLREELLFFAELFLVDVFLEAPFL